MENNGANVIISPESVFGTDMIDIRIKTLDSQMYPLRVNKQIRVTELKEQVSRVTGVLTQNQRIIYAGRVLKDDHPILFYNIQDGHTLHLVPQRRDPSASQNLPHQPGTPDPAHHSSEGQDNLDVISRIFSSVAASYSMIPTENSQVAPESPDAMSILFQELSRIRQLYQRNGAATETPASQSVVPTLIPPRVDPTPEALASLLMATTPLLYSIVNGFNTLSWLIATQPSASGFNERWRIQTNAWTLGWQLREVATFLLELGRVTSTLRISPTMREAAVSSGPAVYVTHLAPSPVPVQAEPSDYSHPETSSGPVPNTGPSSSIAMSNAADVATQYPNASEVESPNIGSSRRQRDTDSSTPQDSKRQKME